MKGKALIRPVLNLRTVNLCIVMDGAHISSVTAVEIMKKEKRWPGPMIQLAEQTWRYTCVVIVCPEQLPQAMFLCSAFGCFTASSWALISFQTAGVLTNQAFHVSLSFTLFCFTIHTWTPKRTDKILSFSESIWSAADMTEVGILPFVRCFRVDCGVKAAKELEIAFIYFAI